ncbi:hypothetical protein AVEN_18785-1 [Araneus ventricosus]|uniref:Uncharacterized protein n=1 Tax=Araneus ventricosus TaxID=182803 RepID=A0A4Y2MN00_ARAVE|nr:hypothetical protein AVEN_18785-1 [Araneus ventricosus]
MKRMRRKRWTGGPGTISPRESSRRYSSRTLFFLIFLKSFYASHSLVSKESRPMRMITICRQISEKYDNTSRSLPVEWVGLEMETNVSNHGNFSALLSLSTLNDPSAYDCEVKTD